MQIIRNTAKRKNDKEKSISVIMCVAHKKKVWGLDIWTSKYSLGGFLFTFVTFATDGSCSTVHTKIKCNQGGHN